MYIINKILDIRLIVFLLTIIYFQQVYGQTQAIFKRIDQTNGLSSNRITGIIKEEKGFVWIGTGNGLNRYDGKEFKIYNSNNSSLESNNISDVLLDKKGRIWIATLGGGLNLYDYLNDDFIVYKKDVNNLTSLPSNQLYKLFEDSKGNLWIGSEDGLCLFAEASNVFIPYHQSRGNDSRGQNIVTSIYESDDGNLWIGTFGGGLNKFLIADKTFNHFESDDRIFEDFIHTISKLNDETLLVGTSGSGLLRFDIKTGKFSNFFNDALKLKREIKIVRSLYTDKQNNLWIGTDGNGIIRVEHIEGHSPKVINYNHKPGVYSSLSGNAVYTIIEDDEDNIWIGTAWNGINVLSQKNNYELIPSDISGLNPIPVLSIYKNENKLYLGSDGLGLTVFDTETNLVKQFSKKFNRDIGGDYIQCIYRDEKELLWLGTYANGVIKFNPKTETFNAYKHDPKNSKSISFNDVRSIIEDNNNLWIASWGGGLNYFDRVKNEFTAFRENINDSTSISSDNIVAMIKTGDTLWLGTYGGGINLFDVKTRKAKRLNSVNQSNNSIGNNILSLLKDSRNNIWIGDSEGKINCFSLDKRSFKNFDDNEVINGQSEVAIEEDNAGNIWFSTENGIYKYDYLSENFTNFPSLAGSYRINSVFKDDDGLLYFGRSDGVLRFNPKNISNENTQPEVKITNFKLFNEELAIGANEIITKNITSTESIILKHDLNVLTFEFAALQFPFSDQSEYAIQMEGFDKDWRQIGTDRTVTYTNLFPGRYVFKVKSKAFGGDWGDNYSSINIEILKPFWMQWWAILAYILVFLFVLYLFRKYTVAWENLKSNLKLEKLTHEKDIELYDLKQQFFTNISHDIRTPVTLISGAINRLLDRKELFKNDLRNPFDTIKKNGDKLVDLVNELLDYRRLEHDKIKLHLVRENLVEFCEEIYLSFKEMALDKGIDFVFKTNADKVLIWYDKHQLEKVFYNLLSNAFKFSKTAGTIEFSILEMEQSIQLQIKDRGVGIAKNQLDKIFNRFYQSKHDVKSNGFGLGLTISKEIVELHGGEIIINSKKNEGTEINIILKKGKEHFDTYSIIEDENDNVKINSLQIDNVGQPIQSREKSLNSKKQTLLVVDDNIEILEYITEILNEEYEIIKALNGEEALEITYSSPIDLIISDIMMPVMDGIALTKALKTDMRTSHIPVLLLTARASFAHKIEGFDIGADEYITKPFNELLLKTRIKGILKTRKLLHEKFWKKELIPISRLNLNKSDEAFMSKLIQILEDNLSSKDLNVNFVCGELAMSHSVVYKKIKSLTNMTYVEFVRDFRLKTAKKLIEEHNFSVLDACYHVGYSDRKYFSKLFKKRFGNNPSEYLSK
ncbi:two-component regulator propeller domain-containing protein [Algibacter sp. 2305UL17-15]|uniref:hybrid sensor histidine kinase/response regulator transcription factor n=1 Tax=Algibacter sp. 2305UL17-15 TaxID=3231268 RepID=UPI003458483D